MKKIFISSIIKGFESFRKAAMDAVLLLDHKPIMAESFGARPISSEKACLDEVENSDVYIGILGKKFGFETKNGESVTQSEFRRAKKLNKEILIFIQQMSDMEEKQVRFKEEVEDFNDGFFRENFGSEDDLKNAIIKALHKLNSSIKKPIPKEAFEKIISEDMPNELGRNIGRNEPELMLSFLPQPQSEIDIIKLESELDSVFQKIFHAGLTTLKDGYEKITSSKITGISASKCKVIYFRSGLVSFIFDPTGEKKGFDFNHFVIPPSKLKDLALKCFGLIEARQCWAYFGLKGVGHQVIQEIPEFHKSGWSMGMHSKNSAEEFEFFQSFQKEKFEAWVTKSVGIFSRIFQ